MKDNQLKIEKLIAELSPNGVEFRELRRFADILNGYSFKSNKYSKDGIRVIRISDVQKGKMSDKDLRYYPIQTKKEISRFLLKENDLVMSLTGNVGRVAMLSRLDLPAGLNQRVACIRIIDDGVLTRYLFHFFNQDSFETEAMNNATGGGQKNMSTTWLGKYKIPIPPLPIQQEIVKILDSFTELEAELEARKKQYEYYKEQLFKFGPDVQYQTLGDICDIGDGLHGTPKYDELGRYFFINGNNLMGGKVNTNGNAKRVNDFVYKKNGIEFSSDKTVLMSINGTIGSVALYNNELIVLGKSVAYFNIKSDYIKKGYLFYFLQTNFAKAYFEKSKTGATIMNLGLKSLRTFKIPVPKLTRQQHIISILDKYNLLINDISIGLPAELEARRQQYEYYRNKLLTFKEYDK